MATQPWHETAAARRILNRIASNPPAGRFHRAYYPQSFDEAFRYEGPEVHRMHAVKSAYEQRVLNACHETGDYSPFAVACEMSVDDAIDAVVDRAAVVGSAAA